MRALSSSRERSVCRVVEEAPAVQGKEKEQRRRAVLEAVSGEDKATRPKEKKRYLERGGEEERRWERRAARD